MYESKLNTETRRQGGTLIGRVRTSFEFTDTFSSRIADKVHAHTSSNRSCSCSYCFVSHLPSNQLEHGDQMSAHSLALKFRQHVKVVHEQARLQRERKGKIKKKTQRREKKKKKKERETEACVG